MSLSPSVDYILDSLLTALVPSLATSVTVSSDPASTTSSVRTSVSPSWGSVVRLGTQCNLIAMLQQLELLNFDINTFGELLRLFKTKQKPVTVAFSPQRVFTF